jgi:hypothetical protein
MGEFNTLSCATAQGYTYYYFKQYSPNISLNTLTVELERIIAQLVDYFGVDELGRGKLDRKELVNKDWEGREWRIGEMGIILSAKEGIVLSFFKAALAKNQPE